MFILVEDFNRPGLSRVPIDRSLTRSQTGTPRHPVRPLTANIRSFLCGLRAMEPTFDWHLDCVGRLAGVKLRFEDKRKRGFFQARKHVPKVPTRARAASGSRAGISRRVISVSFRPSRMRFLTSDFLLLVLQRGSAIRHALHLFGVPVALHRHRSGCVGDLAKLVRRKF
jgi:hypothetical protein